MSEKSNNSKAVRRAVIGSLLFLFARRAIAIEKRKQVLLIAESNVGNNPQTPLNTIFRQTLDYVERELNLQFDYRRYPWKRLLQGLNEGEGLAFGLSKTRERMATMDFSVPAYAYCIWLIVRSDQTFPFSSMADLRGKTIGVVRGSSYGEEFDKAKASFLATEEDVFSLPSRLKKLLSKRMDVMLFGHDDTDPRRVEAFLNKAMPDIAPDTVMPAGISFKVLDKPLVVDYIHFAIQAKKDTDLIQQIDRALKKAQLEGALPSLIEHKK